MTLLESSLSDATIRSVTLESSIMILEVSFDNDDIFIGQATAVVLIKLYFLLNL